MAHDLKNLSKEKLESIIHKTHPDHARGGSLESQFDAIDLHRAAKKEMTSRDPIYPDQHKNKGGKS